MSERCVGVVAVAAPSDVEQDPLFLVPYDVSSRQGLRRGAVPVAFRSGTSGFGLVSVSAARRLPVDDRHAQPPFLPMSLDCPTMRKSLVAPHDVALLEGVRRDDDLDSLLFGVGEDATSPLVPALWHVRMRSGIAADMGRPGFAPRCIHVHIAFLVSKLYKIVSFETEKEGLSERRHQLRIDTREETRAASVRQGRVPEGPHYPHEARALYPGGRAHAGPREAAARRAGVLSVTWGYCSSGARRRSRPHGERRRRMGGRRRPTGPFTKRAYRARARRSRRRRSPSLFANSCAGHPRALTLPADGESQRPGILRTG